MVHTLYREICPPKAKQNYSINFASFIMSNSTKKLETCQLVGQLPSQLGEAFILIKTLLH